jgi:hypothetical protein
MTNTHKILIRKADGNESLRMTRRRCEENIQIRLREIRREHMDCMFPFQDTVWWPAVANKVYKLPVVQKKGNSLTTCKITKS